ncbi:MAG TPA: hypothetical protein VHL09_15905 [Dehalococcoidia bacterium]|nr:hypothetical protein [Dehalococcoidia bacterium]
MARAGGPLPLALVGVLLVAGCLRPQPDAAAPSSSRGLTFHLFDAERAARESAPTGRPAEPAETSPTPVTVAAQAPVYAPSTPVSGPAQGRAVAPSSGDRGASIPFAPAAAARPPGFDPSQIFRAIPSATAPTRAGAPGPVILPRPGDPPPGAPAGVPISVPPVYSAPPAEAPRPSSAPQAPAYPVVVAQPGPSSSVEIVPAEMAGPVTVALADPEPPTATATSEPLLPQLLTVTPVPSSTSTPVPPPSATPVACAGDERIGFDPASPVAGSAFTAAARSSRAHLYVGLEGPGGPQFTGASREGQVHVWRWQVMAGSPGSVSYSFVVDGRVCASASVQVQAPEPTPSATPALSPDAGRSSVSVSAGQAAPGATVYVNAAVRNANGQPLADRLVGVTGGRTDDQIGAPARTGSDGVASIAVTLGDPGTAVFQVADLGSGLALGQVAVSVVAPATSTVPATNTAPAATATVPAPSATPPAPATPTVVAAPPTVTSGPTASATSESAPTIPGG